MKWLRNWKTRILLLFAVIGPGFITANVDNDAGGIYTYSSAGAHFGYQLLWSIIPITFALIVVQEMSARMGAVTGKGLSDLIREEYGLRLTFLMMTLLVLVNFSNVVAEFVGIATSMELLDVSRYISVPLSAGLVWLLVVKGNYKSVEKIFVAASFFYICYIIAGVLAKPGWTAAIEATVLPPEKGLFWHKNYIYMLVGVIGTTIAPWMQFYLQASIVEKGVTPRQYNTSRLDVIFGCFFTDIVAWFIIVACAATLYLHNQHDIHEAADAAKALGPLAGKWAKLLFGAGLFNASLFAASILPLSTAYTVCEGLGVESGLDKKFGEARIFYWFYTILVVAGAAMVLIPNFPMIKITLLSQVLNGVLLPPVLIFMLLLINKKRLMGKYVNGRVFNIIAWVTAIVIMALTVAYMFASSAESGG
ncbi:MAG TPA: Nramp family divalent metal transporter [Candidatus Angelobacter sp.]|jgi:Mn2+/Fe2+ NRAMP family transporter|nr:Nramp family divalent metal transporter [Candidatus Angelobacter sp.]